MTREQAKQKMSELDGFETPHSYGYIEAGELIDQIYDQHEAELKAKDERIAELEAKSKNIICLCGSTKFKTEFEQAIREESTNGNIVLSVCQFTHADKLAITEEQKMTFDKLHFQKIELAEKIVVINPNGYIGESTQKEIDYAKSLGKPIKYFYNTKEAK